MSEPRRKSPHLFDQIRESSERTDPDYVACQDLKNVAAYRTCATELERIQLLRNLSAAERRALLKFLGDP